MKTILFPTDFSTSALDILRYIAGLCNQIGIPKLILYHSYEISNPDRILLIDLLVPTPFELDELKSEANKNFINLNSTILPLLNKEIAVEYISDDRSLIKAIREITDLHKVDLVAMGLTGIGKGGKNTIGRNTSRVMNECNISLMIIPNNAVYTGIEICMLVCELKSIADRLPAPQLSEFLKQVQARLFIVNVDHKESSGYRKLGLLEQFFHKSISHRLAIKSFIPLLILHKN